MTSLLMECTVQVAKILHGSRGVYNVLLIQAPHIKGVAFRLITVVQEGLAERFLTQLSAPERIPLGSSTRLASPTDTALRLLNLKEMSILPALPARPKTAHNLLRMIDIVFIGKNWQKWALRLSQVRHADSNGFLRPFSTREEWVHVWDKHLIFDPNTETFVPQHISNI